MFDKGTKVAPGKQRDMDFYEIQMSLGYKVRPCLKKYLLLKIVQRGG